MTEMNEEAEPFVSYTLDDGTVALRIEMDGRITAHDEGALARVAEGMKAYFEAEAESRGKIIANKSRRPGMIIKAFSAAWGGISGA